MFADERLSSTSDLLLSGPLVESKDVRLESKVKLRVLNPSMQPLQAKQGEEMRDENHYGRGKVLHSWLVSRQFVLREFPILN